MSGKEQTGQKARAPQRVDHAAAAANGAAGAIRGIIYRDAFRICCWIILGLLIALVAAVIGLVVVSSKPEPEPIPIGINADGSITKIVPLSNPVASPTKIQNFVADCATRAYSWSFLSYKEVLSGVREDCFTDDGWRKFSQAIVKANLVEDVRENRWAMHTTPMGSAIIRDKGTVGNGILAYRVDVPLVTTSEARGIRPQTRERMITAVVIRVPQSERPLGLAINRFEEE